MSIEIKIYNKYIDFNIENKKYKDFLISTLNNTLNIKIKNDKETIISLSEINQNVLIQELKKELNNLFTVNKQNKIIDEYYFSSLLQLYNFLITNNNLNIQII